jgi:hypothetical protein
MVTPIEAGIEGTIYLQLKDDLLYTDNIRPHQAAHPTELRILAKT